MNRNKPYRKRVMALDIIMLALTHLNWLVIMALRELYAFTVDPA